MSRVHRKAGVGAGVGTELDEISDSIWKIIPNKQHRRKVSGFARIKP
ncbi:hypothetical protein J2X61_005104 [Bacillus sp. 3255]|nr:hypothetical protein [Bacillus sp. 3255]